MPARHILENRLEAYFRSKVRIALGGKVIKMAPTTAGVPDRLVLLPLGRMYLVELKTDTGALSAIQRHWHSEAERLGHEVHVLYGTADIDSWIREIAQRQDPKKGKPGPRRKATQS